MGFHEILPSGQGYNALLPGITIHMKHRLAANSIIYDELTKWTEWSDDEFCIAFMIIITLVHTCNINWNIFDQKQIWFQTIKRES